MIHATVQRNSLLASARQVHEIWGRFDHAEPGVAGSSIFVWIATAVMLAIVVVIVYRYARRNAGPYTANSPPRLFRDLCRAHRLPLATRRLLKRLAAARQLEHPAMLFVEPGYFNLVDTPADVKPAVDALRGLRAKLFD